MKKAASAEQRGHRHRHGPGQGREVDLSICKEIKMGKKLGKLVRTRGQWY